MKKKIFLLLTVLFAGVLLLSCNKVLDKTNLTAVSPASVWSNADIANAYLNNIYANMMPGNTATHDNGSDEEVPYQRQSSVWIQGTATFDS